MAEDTRRLAAEAATWLGLEIEPSLLEGVAASLDLLRAHAARVMEFELPPEQEMAPVFHSAPRSP